MSHFINRLKRKTLLIPFQNLHSILMTGRESSVTLKTKREYLKPYGKNSITMDGLSGRFITFDMKVKEKLAI